MNSQIDAQFDVQLGQVNQDLEKGLAQSKRIELPYSLIEAGRATGPLKRDFSDLLRLYPTTFAAEVIPPYLIIRSQIIPPRPWPLTIGGLPVQFSTDEYGDSYDRGWLGRGRKCLKDLDPHNMIDYSEDVLQQAVGIFQESKIKIRDIFWFGGFWQITIPDSTDIKILPSHIAASPAFY